MTKHKSAAKLLPLVGMIARQHSQIQHAARDIYALAILAKAPSIDLVLHYLALRPDQWRVCPTCLETVHYHAFATTQCMDCALREYDAS